MISAFSSIIRISSFYESYKRVVSNKSLSEHEEMCQNWKGRGSSTWGSSGAHTGTYPILVANAYLYFTKWQLSPETHFANVLFSPDQLWISQWKIRTFTPRAQTQYSKVNWRKNKRWPLDLLWALFELPKGGSPLNCSHPNLIPKFRQSEWN